MAKDRIMFTKNESARFISHLDLMRTMQRAFLRAGVQIWHTEGFHPHPYTAIPLPLPLFFSSECEILEFGLENGATRESLPEQLNAALPAGIRVQSCYTDGAPFRELAHVRYGIDLEFESDCAAKAMTDLREMLSRESLIITKRSKKAKSGQTQLDIIEQVHGIESLTGEGKLARLEIVLRAQNPGLNPELLITAFRAEYPQYAAVFARFHRMAILNEALELYR